MVAPGAPRLEAKVPRSSRARARLGVEKSCPAGRLSETAGRPAGRLSETTGRLGQPSPDDAGRARQRTSPDYWVFVGTDGLFHRNRLLPKHEIGVVRNMKIDKSRYRFTQFGQITKTGIIAEPRNLSKHETGY